MMNRNESSVVNISQTLLMDPDDIVVPLENQGTVAAKSTAKKIVYFIFLDILYRSSVNGEFSFGGLVAPTSGSHSDE